MSLHPGRYVREGELDWEIIPLDWWNTSFMAVSWSFNSNLQSSKPQRSHFRGSLFVNEESRKSHLSLPIVRSSRELSTVRRNSEEDDDLNLELVGVKFALEAVMVYERDVGFEHSDFPDLGLNKSALESEVDLSSDVDEKDLQAGKDQWNEMLEELMNGPAFGSTADSDESLESSFIGSISSYGSIESIPMPSTPKPKSFFNDVEITTSSPSGSLDGNRSHAPNFSPSRSLSATASSFIPTFCSHLSEEPSQFALSQDISQKPPTLFSPSTSFASFTFPTLNTAFPAVKIKKDDQGFFSDAQVEEFYAARSSSDLLPPFLQDASQRNRSRKSRTREIVDQLRSQTAPDLTKSSPNLEADFISTKYASLSPSPTGEDTNLVAPRLSVSEDGGGPSRLSTPWDEDDGWIDITQPTAVPAAEQKSKRTRELFLALTRRRTDSSSSGDLKETNLATDPVSSLSRDISKSPSPSPSESPSPPNPSTSNVTSGSDGWIEGKTTAPPEPQKKPKSAASHSKDSHSHSRKKSSHHNSRTSISASPHVQTPFSAAPSCYPQLSPTLIPHPHSQHMVSSQTATFPYFFPAYPAISMPSPYAAAFMQMPGYPMGMSMHGAHLVPTAGPVVHPMSGIQYMIPPRGASTKPVMTVTPPGTSNVSTSHRAKHNPLW